MFSRVNLLHFKCTHRWFFIVSLSTFIVKERLRPPRNPVLSVTINVHLFFPQASFTILITPSRPFIADSPQIYYYKRSDATDVTLRNQKLTLPVFH